MTQPVVSRNVLVLGRNSVFTDLQGNIAALQASLDRMGHNLLPETNKRFSAYKDAVIAKFRSLYEAAGPGTPAKKPPPTR